MLIVDPHISQQTMLKSIMRRIQCLITAINAEINFICGDLFPGLRKLKLIYI